MSYHTVLYIVSDTMSQYVYRVTQIKSCNFKRPKLLEISIFDLSLVKPKCVLGVADFFSFQLFVYNFQLFVYNFLKKSATPKTHFGIYNLWSRKHNYGATAI